MSLCLMQTGYRDLQCSDPRVLSLPPGGGVGTLQTPQPLAKTTFLLKGQQKPIGPGKPLDAGLKKLAPFSPEKSSLVPSAQKMDSGQATGAEC